MKWAKTLAPSEEQWRSAKAIINPRGFGRDRRADVAERRLELKSHVDLDPSQSSPLRDLLTAKAAAPMCFISRRATGC